MQFCYIDESGTPQIPGNTSHYILAGISIPVEKWKNCDQEIKRLKAKFSLTGSEIHVAWILRKYIEQDKIKNFDSLDYSTRIYEVSKIRKSEILRIQRSGNAKLLRQIKKNYDKTEPYIHLSYNERRTFIVNVAKKVSKWGFCRLFAECIDKIYFDPNRSALSVDEQAFEQLVSRFETYLEITQSSNNYGLLIHDNNDTVSRKLTELMKSFHKKGTLWTQIKNIIETPLFVDSQLTSMVQIADLCSYSIRRYLENGEEELFKLIYKRADRKDRVVVGIRHFSDPSCPCVICKSHKHH